MDRDFPAINILRTRRDHVMRAAVFSPLFGAGWSDDDAEHLLGRTRKLWRTYLSRRHRELGDGPRQYARNCPPFGISSDSARCFPCQQPQVCPFCWARNYVRNAHMHLTRQFKACRGSNALSVLEFRARVVLPLADIGESIAEHLGSGETRGVEADRLCRVGHLGGVQLRRFELVDAGVACERSGVFLVRRAEWSPPLSERDADLLCRVHERASHAAIGDSLARRFAYPAWILRADVTAVAAYVAAVRGRHLLAKYKPRSPRRRGRTEEQMSLTDDVREKAEALIALVEEEVPDRARGKAPEYFESVTDFARDVITTVARTGRATAKQLAALSNMESGVRKWIR